MFYTNATHWAENLFGEAKLGDIRRTRRLVTIAANMSRKLGKSLVKSCHNTAEIEAAYRFMRNPAVKNQAIESSGFDVTSQQAVHFSTMLAIEDTTSLNFSYQSIRDELGHITTSKKARGMLAHSVLLYAPDEQQIIGLIEQTRWSRDLDKYGLSNKQATQTPYLEKESFKWERASRRIHSRLGDDVMKRVISVCDREADLYEYLTYKTTHQQRFVVRSCMSRHIEESSEKLYGYSDSLTSAGERELLVPQKGGRKARKTVLEIKYAPITIKVPSNKSGSNIPLYYVACVEKGKQQICWHLLTTEPVTTVAQAHKIVGYYETRWLIEDYHKAWKSGGTQVEDVRMQSRENLEKMVVILAFVAIRVMQLRLYGNKNSPRCEESCESLLAPTEWKLLWLKREKTELPASPPSIEWAYINIAKLAGWHDSKRTGIVGWKTLWEGWFLLETILDGYHLAQSLNQKM